MSHVIRVVLLCLLTGCGGCVGYNLHLSLSDDYARALGDDHVFVHIVPVNPRDRAQFETLSLDDYWQYGGTNTQIPREEGTLMYELSAQNPTILLSKKDAVWKQWRDRGATELMILSSRPAPDRPLPGEQDPRRRFIPTDRRAWASRDVVISLTANGLRIETPLAKP